ncbi:MAG: hypothetical protein GY793_03020 [Proteobacteria bacterium]|nr:hypothetical protein [Pseudomonadota bacterium]
MKKTFLVLMFITSIMLATALSLSWWNSSSESRREAKYEKAKQIFLERTLQNRREKLSPTAKAVSGYLKQKIVGTTSEQRLGQ